MTQFSSIMATVGGCLAASRGVAIDYCARNEAREITATTSIGHAIIVYRANQRGGAPDGEVESRAADITVQKSEFAGPPNIDDSLLINGEHWFVDNYREASAAFHIVAVRHAKTATGGRNQHRRPVAGKGYK